MPELRIENAPEEIIQALRAIADRSHGTVSAVALDYLPRTAPLSPADRAALVKEIRAMSPNVSGPDCTTLIRRDRDGLSANELLPDEVVKICRELRSLALQKDLPDSSPGIRADRDVR